MLRPKRFIYQNSEKPGGAGENSELSLAQIAQKVHLDTIAFKEDGTLKQGHERKIEYYVGNVILPDFKDDLPSAVKNVILKHAAKEIRRRLEGGDKLISKGEFTWRWQKSGLIEMISTYKVYRKYLKPSLKAKLEEHLRIDREGKELNRRRARKAREARLREASIKIAKQEIPEKINKDFEKDFIEIQKDWERHTQLWTQIQKYIEEGMTQYQKLPGKLGFVLWNPSPKEGETAMVHFGVDFKVKGEVQEDNKNVKKLSSSEMYIRSFTNIMRSLRGVVSGRKAYSLAEGMNWLSKRNGASTDLDRKVYEASKLEAKAMLKEFKSIVDSESEKWFNSPKPKSGPNPIFGSSPGPVFLGITNQLNMAIWAAENASEK